jgi:uncharacterized protein YuzE
VTYYDRQADIVFVALNDAVVERAVEREWGLIELGADGAPVGMEYWNASERLPDEFLAALPAPPRRLAAAR